MSDPSGATNGDWDREEDGPSGLYEDIDDSISEAAEREQEEQFLEDARTTLTCFPCVFRIMSADIHEIVRIGNEHKDCTFTEPLLPRDDETPSNLIELITDAICSVPPNEERAPGRDGPRRVARAIADALVLNGVLPNA